MKKDPNQTWIVPLSVMAVVVGYLFATSWKTPEESTQPVGGRSGAVTDVNVPESADVIAERDEEIRSLRDQITELQNAMGERSSQADVLNKRFDDLQQFAGLSAIEGPGIEIVLRDSEDSGSDVMAVDRIIHDADLLRVVNELWMSGAEAISVGKQRVVGRTYFRCEGSIINVTGVRTSSPAVIRAIGDTETLYGALNMPGGYLDIIRQTDPSMVDIRKKEIIRIEAFSGNTQFEYARPAQKEEDSGE